MPFRLIDTHAHLDFREFTGDRHDVISRAANVGVGTIIAVGSDAAHVKSTLEIAIAYERVFAVVGIHPQEAVQLFTAPGDIDQKIDDQITMLKNYVNYPKCVGIGETGFDFYHIARAQGSEQPSIQNLQQRLFIAQIELALASRLPLVLHSRDAYEQILETLKPYSTRGTLRGVVHSFEGDYATARKFIDAGFMLAYNGLVTYEHGRDFLETVREVPLQSLVLETNAPYLAPEPLRGQRNEPSHLDYIARRIADIRGISPEDVAEQTSRNAEKLFTIK
ncbi:MAG: TatD family hydrolase [Patescibacteria group bacterium]|nr:TatD family hydrolase [Patescibacteria group bacterium]MDD5716133.1 TatD family hydrolase [Patescibacteria group bacterium]